MGTHYLISDAAKQVAVEAHVLRYWEEELSLPIKRNELGHRYYTEADVKRFQEIKELKERGLQLKAIKVVLKKGKLDVLEEGKFAIQEDAFFATSQTEQADLALNQLEESNEVAVQEENEDKAKRLQWLLKRLIRETLEENNKALCQEMKESLMKEMDYQFRMQEDRLDEHFRLIDEKISKKRKHLKTIKDKTKVI